MKAQHANVYYDCSLRSYGTILCDVGAQDIRQREPLELFASSVKTNLSSLTSGGGGQEILRLFSEVEKGDVETVKALLKAQPGLAKSRQEVVDFYGCTRPPFEIATLPLDAGADINALGIKGFAPCRYAYFRNQAKMIEFLKSRGGHD